MKLIAGLGNPGKKYEMTRHNVGFLCLEYFQKKHNLNFKLNKDMNAEVAEANINGEKCIFLKPQTFMNLSGEAVDKVTRYYKIANEDLVVIHDDMDLPLGTLRLREKGSAGGHNGIKNIILHLATEEFKRIRVGISGHEDIDAVDYVLGRFSKEEQEVLNKAFVKVTEAVEDFIKGDPFIIIMGRYNGSYSE